MDAWRKFHANYSRSIEKRTGGGGGGGGSTTSMREYLLRWRQKEEQQEEEKGEEKEQEPLEPQVPPRPTTLRLSTAQATEALLQSSRDATETLRTELQQAVAALGAPMGECAIGAPRCTATAAAFVLLPRYRASSSVAADPRYRARFPRSLLGSKDLISRNVVGQTM